MIDVVTPPPRATAGPNAAADQSAYLYAAVPSATAGTSGTTQARPGSTFESVGNAPPEHDGFTLMVAAYALIWIILMAWLMTMWNKSRAIHSRLDDLDRAIDRAIAKDEKLRRDTSAAGKPPAPASRTSDAPPAGAEKS